MDCSCLTYWLIEPSDSMRSISFMRFMERLTVLRLVRVPPSQRSVTKGCPQALADSLTASWACFLVPTNRMLPPLAAVADRNLQASSIWPTVLDRSMTWMPLRASKMKRFILGFQRRV